MKVTLVMDDPRNCANCPCISGYGRKCLAADKAFGKHYHKYLEAYPKPYKPEWCPLVEAGDMDLPKNCETCKHKDDAWDSAACEGCCPGRSNWEVR